MDIIPKKNFSLISVRRPGATAGERGYALIAVTLCIVVLLGFAGLALDATYLEHVKRRMQTAADAGALAGAFALFREKGESQITADALSDSALNGYQTGINHTTVTVNHPPASGRYAGDTNAVEVIVQQSNQPMWFMWVSNATQATVAARAVAHLGAGNGCIYALNPTESHAFVVSGGAKIVTDCGIFVNSSSEKALVVNGSTTDGPAITASTVDVVGGVDAKPGAIDPDATSGLLPTTDPLSNIPQPTISGCDYTDFKITDNMQLQPGTYCGGLSITSQTGVTFAPGIYSLAGGGLSISGGSASGTGVMFFDTVYTGFSYNPITISGNATVNFTAATTGTYAGILFFNDRTLNLSGADYTNNITGGTNSYFDGIMYFPNAEMVYTGTSSTNGANTVIIADTVKLAGTPSFSGDFSGLPGGSPLKAVVLGE